MTRTNSPAPVGVFHFDGDERPFDGYDYLDFEDELKLGEKLAERARKQPAGSILSFGYAGNGNNAFAQALARKLFDQKYDVVWLETGSLIARRAEETKQALDKVQAELDTDRDAPVLLVIKALDSVNPDVFQVRSLEAVRSLINGRADSRRQLVTLATASYPDLPLEMLGRSSTDVIFFDWPDVTKAADFLRLILKKPGAKNVATNLFELSHDAGYRYTSGSLIAGFRRMSRMGDAIRQLPPHELAETIAGFCSPTSERLISEYRRTTRALRRRAEATLRSLSTSRKEGVRAGAPR